MIINKTNQNLIWLDLEMTGLDVNYNKILEIATLITDKNLNILAEGPILAIYQSNVRLSLMDLWNIKTHHRTGLIKRVKNSFVTESIGEQLTLNFLKQWIPPQTSPMCGNSIHQDRKFLIKYMPELEAYFHYRSIDVSTLKELIKRWCPNILTKIKLQNKNCHTALQDIKTSIKELSLYRKLFIKY